MLSTIGAISSNNSKPTTTNERTVIIGGTSCAIQFIGLVIVNSYSKITQV